MTDPAIRLSHVALAVGDIEASRRFYTEGLGFVSGPAFDSGDEVAAVSEVEAPVSMTSQYFTKDSIRLELMEWRSPLVHGSPLTTRNNRGITHLSFEVDDIAAVEEKLLKLGGIELPEARVVVDKGSFSIALVFLADPDGTRIELLQRIKH